MFAITPQMTNRIQSLINLAPQYQSVKARKMFFTLFQVERLPSDKKYILIYSDSLTSMCGYHTKFITSVFYCVRRQNGQIQGVNFYNELF